MPFGLCFAFFGLLGLLWRLEVGGWNFPPLCHRFPDMFMRWFEHGQVYHPDKVLDPIELKRAGPFEDVWLKTSDGVSINGWFFTAPADSPRSDLVVLLCHGNAGNISGRVDLCQTFIRSGLNVFSFDYRGF